MTTAMPPAEADLTCPLCRYNLRGLTDPRCPECGFRFTWDELRDEQRNGHRYLFEHARRRRWSSLPQAFWSTYWRTCRPRRFWREVSPANPVAAGRLLAFALTPSLVLGLIVAVLLTTSVVIVYRANRSARAMYTPVPGQPGTYVFVINPSYAVKLTSAELDESYPLPPSREFFRQASLDRWGVTYPSIYAAAAVILGWPWLTMAALLVYQASMRRAQVDHRHLLRVVVYGCDFSLLLPVLAVAFLWAAPQVPNLRDWFDAVPSHGAVPLLAVVLACAAVATYRLTFAYGRYLRFDRPLLTVLAAQAIVVLFVGVVLVQLA